MPHLAMAPLGMWLKCLARKMALFYPIKGKEGKQHWQVFATRGVHPDNSASCKHRRPV